MSTDVITTPADLLEAAAKQLELHGWCRGTLQDETGRLCTIGAMRAALGISPIGLASPRDEDKLDKAFTIIKKEFNAPSTAAWNDGVCKGEVDAIDTLYRLAKKYQEVQP